ncbi:oxygenase [Streptomyces sp. Ag109_O5-1]|uniref:FAD-dependent monooxygenase n=1 Tax=Streptomyces sp. Ag109_O5-1 TaxID=1938851 RepID=UPI000FB5AF44|nr:FAD-dependent monooxygenase [Streptomyces sp. Ag109_O5-1]RPE43831.1 oxygenase [Streptomyces sp. Ag109_O5-1]
MATDSSPARPRTGPADTRVIVVGAGPVGLFLAGELRLGGADVVVLERLRTPTTESRASTLHARTVELFDCRGLLAALGDPSREPRGHFGGVPMDLTMPSPHSGQWKVPQTRTEELLQEWAGSLGADVRRGWEVRGLTQRDGHVDVVAETPDGPRRLRAAYLVACDGEDSTVRRLTGADFPGTPAGRELLRADIAGIDIPNRRFERLERGLAIAARMPGGTTRVMVHEFGTPAPERTGPPAFAEVVGAWRRVTGEDLGGGRPVWLNAFGDANQQLTQYRHGRVLFAGDAAHRQMPSGGQALNLGLQDAANLGWKLAAVVCGRASQGLLDTYHDERHEVGRRVLANIRAQALLLLGDRAVEPARTLLGELIAAGPARQHLAAMITGLDIRHPVGGGSHPLLGARLPLGTLPTPDGPVEVAALLRTGRGLLLVSESARAELRWLGKVWSDRVTPVAVLPDATGPLHDTEGRPYDARSPLHDADGLLVRPDGHVAWAGSDPWAATAAIRHWFGRPDPGL